MAEQVRTFHDDCRHFRCDRPCLPHKERGQTCAGCPDYDPAGKRVLVIKLGAMGDVLRTTCLLPGLARKYAGDIVWVTRLESLELLRNNPLVAETWPWDDALPSRLDGERFRAVINPDAERLSAGLCLMARADEKQGFALDEAGAVRPLSAPAARWFRMGVDDGLKKQNTRTYQSLVCEACGLPAEGGPILFNLTAAERDEAAAFRDACLPADTDFTVGFNTGGGGRWKRKQWTFDGFCELGRRILQDTRAAVLLYGGREETEFRARLAGALDSPRVVTVHSEAGLRQFAARLSLSDILVTGDTLGMHLALALGKRVVAIFGPTSANEIELYDQGVKVLPEIPCRSFYRPDCHATPCCMETIQAETVFSRVMREAAILQAAGVGR